MSPVGKYLLTRLEFEPGGHMILDSVLYLQATKLFGDPSVWYWWLDVTIESR